MRLTAILMTLCLSQAAIFANTTETRFLRLEITEYSSSPDAPTEVKVRLPLSMFRAFRQNFDTVVDEAGFSENYQMWADAWREVVTLGPTDFVEIQDGDSSFKLSTTSSHLLIQARDGDELDNVTIRIPLVLGSVFFDGDGFPSMDEMIHAMTELPAESLMEMTGETVDMRVWIE